MWDIDLQSLTFVLDFPFDSFDKLLGILLHVGPAQLLMEVF